MTIARLDSLSFALLLVGLASAAFHATLRQGPQLADDLSMLYLTGTLMQRLYCDGCPPGLSRLLSAGVWLPTCIASLVYARSGNLLIHVYTFAAMVGLIGLRLLYLIYLQPRPEQETAALAARFWSGAAYLAVAYTVWNVDLELCLQLRDLRRHVGLPWVWLLELHGWWHLLTAVGAARFLELVRLLCDRDPEGGRNWLHEHTVPWFRVRTVMTAKSKADLDRVGATR
jgi:dihydroceramidase